MQSYPDQACYELIWHLCRQREFGEQLRAVRYRDIFRNVPWSLVVDLALKIEPGMVGHCASVDQLKEYHSGILAVASEFVPAVWGPEAIHDWAFDMLRGLATAPSRLPAVDLDVEILPENGRMEISVLLRPKARWADIEEALNKHRREIMDGLRSLPNRTGERDDPNLDRDLEWLAKRLVARESYRDLWQSFIGEHHEVLEWPRHRRKRKKEFRYEGEATDATGDVVGAAIRRRAKDMGIDLTKIRTGRP